MKKFLIPCAIIFLYLVIFYRWFQFGLLAGGDWPFLYPQAIKEIVPLSTWDVLFSGTLGSSSLPKIWFDSYALSIVKLANILSWPLFERIIWFFPALSLSFFAAFLFSKKFGFSNNLRLVSGLIYSLNTYILLIVSGGQAGVMIAYSFLPIPFFAFFNLLENLTFRKSVIFSLTLALLILLDLRVGYMFLAAAVLIFLINFYKDSGQIFLKLIYSFVIPGALVFLLHFFWILPIILMGRNPTSQLGEIYTSSTSLDFFSFAKMENTVAFLHPNWPENMFGKVSFLRPEFLLIPIIGFSSLLFVDKEDKSRKISILSIAVIGLIGVFLAKGTNEPFGQIYSAFFKYIPGFVMFRDPTKWYMLIAISFSILIPYLLENISSFMEKTWKIKNSLVIVCLVFILLWGFLIRDSILGKVKGTLYPVQISSSYQKLADKLTQENEYSRTLWIPNYQTLGYFSNTHPRISTGEFFAASSPARLYNILKDNNTEKILQESSIRYVIVPDDISHKIFINDRKYDEDLYRKTLRDIKALKYLSKIDGFGRIGVFEVKNPKGHFWGVGRNIKVSPQYSSPTKYILNIKNAQKGDVVIFTDSFDSFWEAVGDGQKLQSQEFKVSKTIVYNSFVLNKAGSYSLTIIYKPQQWLMMGMTVSAACFLIIIFYLFIKKK